MDRISPAPDPAPRLPSSVFGAVFGPDGAGVPGAVVLLHPMAPQPQPAPAPPAIPRCLVTDAEGVLPPATAIPGHYWVGVQLPPGALVPGCSPPPPRRIELWPGHDVRLDLNTVRAARHVTGRVVDDAGGPVPDVRVVAAAAAPAHQPWPARGVIPAAARLAVARTDANGRFALGPLPSDRVEVRLDPRALLPRDPLGPRTLVAAFAPVTIDLTAGPNTRRLGALSCRRAPRCAVVVRCRPPRRWGRTEGTVAIARASHDARPPAALWRTAPLDETGTCTISCEVGWWAWVRWTGPMGKVREQRFHAERRGRIMREIATP
ncbi:MAG: hypothetical protein AAF628_13145 [Planctomycetota bacterium]